MKPTTVTIRPGYLTLSDLRNIYLHPVKLILDENARLTMKTSLEFVEKSASTEQITYGINTGIGVLASTRIGKEDSGAFQRSIVISHAVGVGPAIEDGLVRLIVALKVNSLAQGYSGIRFELLQALLTLVNSGVYPDIPVKGSVGASGDLSPLSHLASVLLGDGRARYKGILLSAIEALDKVGLKPITLGPREGVSLINGTQMSTACALKGLFLAEDMFRTAIVCGSLSVEAALGSRKPFDRRLHAIRRHRGQIDTAAVYRLLLEESSEVSESHVHCNRVQDPYSLRCQPQVMGACLTQIRNAAETILTEVNGVSDNPVVVAGDIISGGNFHAEPIAFAADNLALALAEIGSLSERRTALLMDSHMSGLPAFLVSKSGLNTGFMTAHVTCAALVSENKTLSFPASVDSIPTSANQEDHVSMATSGARRLWDMAENVKAVLAIEWMCAVQGLDLRGLQTSSYLEKARSILREKVKFLEKDRFMATDIESAISLIGDGVLISLTPSLIPCYEVHQNGSC